MGSAVSLEQKQAWMLEQQSGCDAVPPPEGAERHFSPAEVAKLWRVSIDFVRRQFAREPGVLVFAGGAALTPAKRRRYTTMRIPESVLKRVHNRVANH